MVFVLYFIHKGKEKSWICDEWDLVNYMTSLMAEGCTILQWEQIA